MFIFSLSFNLLKFFLFQFQSDGVTNYFHIPYMIDLITQASVIVPDFDIPIKQQFIQPEQREHDYVPGSGKAVTSLFGK